MFVILYILLVSLYLYLKKKYPGAPKFLIEFLIYGGVGILIVILRVITSIYIISTNQGIYGDDAPLFAILQALTGLYSVFEFAFIGGITLYDGYNVPLWILIMHYDLTILIGTLALTMFAASLSYGIYSSFALHFKPKRRKNFYVFTTLNEKSLQLAHNIKNKYIHGAKKNHEFVIVFAGPDLEPFDKTSPLCMEAVKSNFLYVSLKKNPKKSLCSQLGIKFSHKLKTMIDGGNGYQIPLYDEHIHIFSFSDEEVENAETVFTEMRKLITHQYSDEAYVDDRLPSSVINFYTLTSTDNSYELYEQRKKDIFKETKNTDKEVNGVTYQASLNRLFQVRLVNEASLASKLCSRNRTNVLSENLALVKALDTPDSEYHALFLGFGRIGSRVLEQLYIDTTFVRKKDEVESKFVATVIDNTISQRFGMYSANHPFFVTCEVEDDSIFDTIDLRSMYQDKKGVINKYYQEKTKAIEKIHFDDVKLQQMKLPLIIAKEAEVKSSKIVKLIDNNSGERVNAVYAFNTICIALGDDDENIAMANMIISDARNEIINRGMKIERPQIIMVHIKNEHNYFKLDTLVPEGFESPLLHVFGFGIDEQLFDYDLIITHKDAQRHRMIYNYLYNNSQVLEDASPNLKKSITLIKDELNYSDKGSVDDRLAFQEVITVLNKDIVKNHDDLEKVSIDAWLDLSEFQKNLDIQAVQSTRILKEVIAEDSSRPLLWCAALEHARWYRFHIAAGWRYGKERIEQLKYHDCIIDHKKIHHQKNIEGILTLMTMHHHKNK